jgi:ParB family chromosome partitioning protein
MNDDSKIAEGIKVKPSLKVIPVEYIEVDPQQPRKNLGDLRELAASIRERGLLQPIMVTQNGPNKYVIIAGERRFTAAKEAGLKEIPALIGAVENSRERFELQIIENLHREDLNPIDEAYAYQRLIKDFGMKQRELAASLTKSPAAISQTLKILDLPEHELNELQTSKVSLSKSVLLEVANEENPAKRRRLIEKAKLGGSVQALRTIRYQKRSSTEAIKLDGATVTLRLHKLNATREDFKRALQAAIKVFDFTVR